jgi:outer membrane autotransporter protein
VGAHGFVNPDFLVGGMVQFDDAKDEANNASGTGWMVGPYFAAKAPDQPLFFEGRLLYGQTDNKISPLGASTDDFKTERMLAQLRATGEYKLQNTTLMPLFDLTYTDDAQKTYTDSLGNTIPGQKIGLTQVTAGMDFKTPLPSQSGALDLTGGLSGIYASTQNGAAAQQDFEGGRGRAHLGLNYTTSTGATLNARTFYDGIGSKHEAYGASLDFNWKF